MHQRLEDSLGKILAKLSNFIEIDVREILQFCKNVAPTCLGGHPHITHTHTDIKITIMVWYATLYQYIHIHAPGKQGAGGSKRA